MLRAQVGLTMPVMGRGPRFKCKNFWLVPVAEGSSRAVPTEYIIPFLEWESLSPCPMAALEVRMPRMSTNRTDPVGT